MRDGDDDAAWFEFESLYRGLILGYCRRRGLQPADAEDTRQIVMMSLSTAFQRGFTYRRELGKFRGYLGRVTANAVSRMLSRPSGWAVRLESEIRDIVTAEEEAPLDEAWEQEWVQHHYRLAMVSVRRTFEERSVRIFERLLAGASTDEVAADFELSTQAVHKVKQRIRNRLKELISAQIAEEEASDDGLQS
jgi:RNA polymerase sigma-70 factor (ECF subfamily)